MTTHSPVNINMVIFNANSKPDIVYPTFLVYSSADLSEVTTLKNSRHRLTAAKLVVYIVAGLLFPPGSRNQT